jgi:hypothetical protein
MFKHDGSSFLLTFFHVFFNRFYKYSNSSNMAGLAALMTRKKRDRRRELEQLKEKLADPVAMAEV